MGAPQRADVAAVERRGTHRDQCFVPRGFGIGDLAQLDVDAATRCDQSEHHASFVRSVDDGGPCKASHITRR
jgi:hypothetical protein